jgi:prolyl-tRNA synthetase
MRWSNYLMPTLKEPPREAQTIAHKLMLRTGLVRKLASGIYEFLPAGFKCLKKIEGIIREEMNKAGGQELLLPTIQPKELWEKTGRWSAYGKELMRLKDRNDRDFCLGPTHEEVITALIGQEVSSWRQLPLLVYQFQTKFRDELRPRFGLIRAREFYMKDAYSFDVGETQAHDSYDKMLATYDRIFARMGLKTTRVSGETGLIGGAMSHEFMVPCETGEDEIVLCPSCNWGSNVKILEEIPKTCPRCKSKHVQREKAIEVGHTFYLGTKYSAPMDTVFADASGKSNPFIMGCYGIGVSRIIAAAIEQSSDKHGIVWSPSIAPFQVLISALEYEKPKIKKLADSLYQELLARNVEVLLDDRIQTSVGVKFKDADLVGIPVRVNIGGRSFAKGHTEIRLRNTGDTNEIELSQTVASVLKALEVNGKI